MIGKHKLPSEIKCLLKSLAFKLFKSSRSTTVRNTISKVKKINLTVRRAGQKQ